MDDLVKLLIYLMFMIMFIWVADLFYTGQKVNKFNELCGTNLTLEQGRWANLAITKDCKGAQ